MSDLVERLRSHMGKADFGDVLRDCHLAADRIEKLEITLRDIIDTPELSDSPLQDITRIARNALEMSIIQAEEWRVSERELVEQIERMEAVIRAKRERIEVLEAALREIANWVQRNPEARKEDHGGELLGIVRAAARAGSQDK